MAVWVLITTRAVKCSGKGDKEIDYPQKTSNLIL